MPCQAIALRARGLYSEQTVQTLKWKASATSQFDVKECLRQSSPVETDPSKPQQHSAERWRIKRTTLSDVPDSQSSSVATVQFLERYFSSRRHSRCFTRDSGGLQNTCKATCSIVQKVPTRKPTCLLKSELSSHWSMPYRYCHAPRLSIPRDLYSYNLTVYHTCLTRWKDQFDCASDRESRNYLTSSRRVKY